MDLLTYLQNYNPYELKHFSGNTYTTRTHDSLKISNGKWMWWSQGIGGKSALDYLIKVENMGFLEAVEAIVGKVKKHPPIDTPAEKKTEKKLLLPPACNSSNIVTQYLLERGIDKEVLNYCYETGRLYESSGHHNAVFVGMDSKSIPRYAALRGIQTNFLGDANGSDKHYSFYIPAEIKCSTVQLFESPIDLLSYATLMKMCGVKWRSQHLLSLAGVYQPAKIIEESKVPAALVRFLKEYPEVENIILHLDNDLAGRRATKAIQAVLPEHYRTQDSPPTKGKDCNDYLCLRLGLPLTERDKKNLKRYER